MKARKLGTLLALLAAGLFLASTEVRAEKWISFDECQANFEPPDDRATVYFFRPKQKTATSVNFWIYDESGVGIALILNNYFVPVFLEPGKHDLTTQKSMLIKPVEFALSVEAGKTYYVRTVVKSGGMKNKVIVEQVSEAEAAHEISSCRLYVSKEVKNDLSKLPAFIGLE